MNAQHVAERSAVYALEDAVAPMAGDTIDLLVTAPQGVAKLRELILSLAVRGKLTARERTDEPASAVLRRARNEITALIDAGTIRKPREAGPIRPDDLPYGIPSGWEWARLASILPFQIGKTPPSKNPHYWNVGGTRWVSITDMSHRGVVTETQRGVSVAGAAMFGYPPLPPGTLLMSFKLTIGKVATLGVPAYHNEAIVSFHPLAGISTAFLAIVLPEAAKLGAAKDALMGATLNSTSLANLLLPLPPLAEQRRIVARVEELMGLCDELEAHGRLQDEQHARLVATLFGALVASTSPEELADNWRRVARHFDLLLDLPAAVDAVEQTILQLAVRGLLVPQDPADELASELLSRIRVEKAKLAKAGEIKQTNALRPVTESNSPFNVPASWVWTRFGELVNHSEAGWSPRCDDGQRQGDTWGVLKVSAVSWGEFRSHENKQLPASLKPRAEYEVHDGDLLISRANTAELVARSVIAEQPEPRLMLSDKLIRLDVSALAERRYANLVNNAEFARAYYAENASGTSGSMKNVSRDVILNLPIPLPPLAEQHRIVARVEELRGLCASLRQRLQQSQATQSNLADALVARAAA